MSIVRRVEEHVAASTLFRHKSLDFEVWGIPEDDTARILYITADIIAVVTPTLCRHARG